MPTEPKKTSTPTLISALRILAAEVESDDGVANMTIAEGADRIEELSSENARLENLTASGVHSCSTSCQRPMCVLRRERDEARAELARVKSERDKLATLEKIASDGQVILLQRCDRQEAELADLRRDKARLDWLEYSPSERLAITRTLYWTDRDTAREAIDAAMKGGRDE